MAANYTRVKAGRKVLSELAPLKRLKRPLLWFLLSLFYEELVVECAPGVAMVIMPRVEGFKGFMANTPIYKVIFYNQDKVYELYARAIYQSDMYGFIEIEEVLFGERSQMIVDPAEEKLKTEFGGVSRSYVPMHSIIRIDEVEKQGVGKIVESGKSSGNITSFPMSGKPGIGGDTKE